MAKTVDINYQTETGMWKAEVGGKVKEAPTARMLRGEVSRELDEPDLEVRVTFDRAMEKELAGIVSRTRVYKKERKKLDTMVDKLNMERYKFAQRALSFKCSNEQVAKRLEMHTSMLAQLMDPRQYPGRRVKALLDGEIQPGDGAYRPGAKPGDDEDEE